MEKEEFKQRFVKMVYGKYGRVDMMNLKKKHLN